MLFKFADQVNPLLIRSFGPRLAFRVGGIKEPVFRIPQSTMKAEQGSGAENDRRAQESARIEERGAESKEETVREEETRGPPAGSPQDQELVFEEQVFGQHRSGPVRSQELNHSAQLQAQKNARRFRAHFSSGWLREEFGLGIYAAGCAPVLLSHGASVYRSWRKRRFLSP
jgi:hypothetical protein